ncbi:DHH family phosphoesterase [Hydrogenimonas sp.]
MKFEEAAAAIDAARHIAVVGHLNPDPDTLGTGLGLWWIFKKLGKRADAVYVSDPLPGVLDFLPGFEKIRHTLHPSTDLVVAVDCGGFDRLGIERPEDAKVVVVDHHRSNGGFGEVNLVDPDASCAAEVAFAWARAAGWEVPPETAENFYAALVGDTGYFGYEGVGADTFAFAKTLVELGARPEFTARMMRERQPLSRLRLLPRVLETLTLYLEGRVAGLEVTRGMLEATGATVNETEDMVDYARSLVTVEVGFMTREEPDGGLKVSLRSKSVVDVGRIAVALGGGGHRRAAGFTLYGQEREAVVETILKMIEQELRS